MNRVKDKVFTIDFDGTIMEHAFPGIGKAKPYAFEVLKKIQQGGGKLILWTCREDTKARKYLTEAVDFCRANGVVFDAVNSALTSHDWRDPSECSLRKPHGHCFIDDRNVGGFIGWEAINKLLFEDCEINWQIISKN